MHSCPAAAANHIAHAGKEALPAGGMSHLRLRGSARLFQIGLQGGDPRLRRFPRRLLLLSGCSYVPYQQRIACFGEQPTRA